MRQVCYGSVMCGGAAGAHHIPQPEAEARAQRPPVQSAVLRLVS